MNEKLELMRQELKDKKFGIDEVNKLYEYNCLYEMINRLKNSVHPKYDMYRLLRELDSDFNDGFCPDDFKCLDGTELCEKLNCDNLCRQCWMQELGITQEDIEEL